MVKESNREKLVDTRKKKQYKKRELNYKYNNNREGESRRAPLFTFFS